MIKSKTVCMHSVKAVTGRTTPRSLRCHCSNTRCHTDMQLLLTIASIVSLIMSLPMRLMESRSKLKVAMDLIMEESWNMVLNIQERIIQGSIGDRLVIKAITRCRMASLVNRGGEDQLRRVEVFREASHREERGLKDQGFLHHRNSYSPTTQRIPVQPILIEKLISSTLSLIRLVTSPIGQDMLHPIEASLSMIRSTDQSLSDLVSLRTRGGKTRKRISKNKVSHSLPNGQSSSLSISRLTSETTFHSARTSSSTPSIQKTSSLSTLLTSATTAGPTVRTMPTQSEDWGTSQTSTRSTSSTLALGPRCLCPGPLGAMPTRACSATATTQT